MKNLLLICFFVGSFCCLSQESQEIYQYAKISFTDRSDLVNLSALNVPIDHGLNMKDSFVASYFSTSEINRAKEAGYTVTILTKDSTEYNRLKNLIDPPCSHFTIFYETPENFVLGSMGGFLTYQEMLDQLDLMQSLYPNLITEKANIGDFLTEGEPDPTTTPPIGGNGIKWIKISDNPNSTTEGEPQILYTGIHHAYETSTVAGLIFFMWYLLENYDSDIEVQYILDNTELYFVPVINPDGYLYNEKTHPNGGGNWRKNRKNGHGVDNNRNYDYFIDGDPNNHAWGGPGSSDDPTFYNYRGTAPFSEVENQAMKWFVEQHNFTMAFNTHGSGGLFIYPWNYGDDTPNPEDFLFTSVLTELASENSFSLTNEFGLGAAGNSDDFMFGTVGTHSKIYSVSPEMGELWPDPIQIPDICREMMYSNLTAAKMLNNFATTTDTKPLFTGDDLNVNSEFIIRRFGFSGDGNFTVNFNPISPNIISVGAPMVFNNLDFLEEEGGSIPYTLDPNIIEGEDIVYELVVQDGIEIHSRLVRKKFGAPTILFEDPGDSVENFITDAWGPTSEDFVSPSSSITDSPFGDYENNASESIELKYAIDLSNAIAATVNFYAKWDTENGSDLVRFHISTDNGETWVRLCGKYNSGYASYHGLQEEWVLEEIDLNEYLGQTVNLRFLFQSDPNDNRDGFYFDDFRINILGEGVILNTLDNEVLRFTVHPNPLLDVLNITTLLENYTIEMYTIHGQLVHRKVNNNGSQTIDYSNLSSGIYLLRLTSAEVSQTLRIVKH